MRLARQSLHEYVRCSKYFSLPWTTKFNIALGIAEGLEFLHAQQIIHCDVHSGNVLIDFVSIYFAQLSFLFLGHQVTHKYITCIGRHTTPY